MIRLVFHCVLQGWFTIFFSYESHETPSPEFWFHETNLGEPPKGPLPAHLVDCEVTTEHNGFELDNKRISPDAMDAFMRNEPLGGVCKRWVPTKTQAISRGKK